MLKLESAKDRKMTRQLELSSGVRQKSEVEKHPLMLYRDERTLDLITQRSDTRQAAVQGRSKVRVRDGDVGSRGGNSNSLPQLQRYAGNLGQVK